MMVVFLFLVAQRAWRYNGHWEGLYDYEPTLAQSRRAFETSVSLYYYFFITT